LSKFIFSFLFLKQYVYLLYVAFLRSKHISRSVKTGPTRRVGPLTRYKKSGWVMFFNPLTRLNPACLTLNPSGSNAGQPAPNPLTCFIWFFLFLPSFTLPHSAQETFISSHFEIKTLSLLSLCLQSRCHATPLHKETLLSSHFEIETLIPFTLSLSKIIPKLNPNHHHISATSQKPPEP